MNDLIADVMQQAYAVRSQLASNPQVSHWIDTGLPIPIPFKGSGKIRLVIIGQDPTVKESASRAKITTVLTLDDPTSPLSLYLKGICDSLDIDLCREVYATNVCKSFFVDLPTAIKERPNRHKFDVITLTAKAWLPLLRQELAAFPDAVIISLGEPVLTVLVGAGGSTKMKQYWGHTDGWQTGIFRPVHSIEAKFSTAERRIYPYVHQPTNGGFYGHRKLDYLEFIRQDESWAK